VKDLIEIDTRGHFKAAYSAEALCWICGSTNHDPRQCKMLTSALADYRSKHLHKGSPRGSGGPRNHTSRGRSSGRGGFTSRNNARGGHHGVHKTKQFKNRKPEDKTVNFRHHGAHAANAVLPPPAYTPPLSENTMAAEEHFAFRATCEHEDQDMYNVYPTCKGATFLKDEDKNERKRIYHEILGSDDIDPGDSNYEAEEETMPPLCDDSSDDEDDERPLTSQVPKLELDPATRMLLNAGAETTNTDNKDPLTQPEPNDDPNLHVTFSDDEEDENNNVLPFPRYFLHLGWETELGFHDHIPLESAIYNIEDVQFHIKGPLILATITDHLAYYFLTQVKDDLIRLGDEIKSSKYLHPEGIAEIHFDLGLLSAKVLHYAGYYGCSTSPSWTLAKDVPDDIINAILTSGVNAPLLIHMAQMHIYYMAYIETFWPHLDTTTFCHAQFQFLGEDANARTTIYKGYIIAYKDNLVLTHRIDHEAMDNWERELNAPHADDGPPCKRRRIGDYEPGHDETERYSPTSPAYCP
jgi:hypothetical protein